VNITDAIARVRFEIGDPVQPFRSTGVGDNQTVLFDLPKQELNEGSLEVLVINGATQTTYTDQTAAQPWNSSTAYASGAVVTQGTYFFSASQASTGQQPVAGGNSYWSDVTDTAFTVNAELGKILLGQPIAINAILIATGTSWALFSDIDLWRIITDSCNQHTYAQEIEERYRDAHGFVDYRETPKNLMNLPAIEEPLLVMLSVVNCFWAMANDAASDSNIQTAEGTMVDRTTRYQHLMQQITALTARYQDYCGQLNVGLYRAETLQLRRTSKTTGRLVPLFRPQEYDDHRWPMREIPAVDHRNDDNSGVPSPLWTSNWGT
jgi:hypothetical protein